MEPVILPASYCNSLNNKVTVEVQPRFDCSTATRKKNAAPRLLSRNVLSLNICAMEIEISYAFLILSIGQLNAQVLVF